MVELILLAAGGYVEQICDALMDELGALSVSVEDADANTGAEQTLFGEPGMAAPSAGWERSVIKALFSTDAAAVRAATLLFAQACACTEQLQAITPVPEQDWVRLTQSQFSPVEISPRFWIVPSWHQSPDGAERVIRLDPGLAFGTGTHPTTRMCLRWIARHAAREASRWARVLDYGCGSGILAIGAALYGARHIDALDIDPVAVETTLANARTNSVVLQAGLPGAATGSYSLVLANILATPLKLLAPLLCAHVEAGGNLVLAGILERQGDELKAAYAAWLSLEVCDAEEGWILMAGRRVV